MWDGYDSYPNTYLRDDEKVVLLELPFIGPDGMNVPALPPAALALLTVLILLAQRRAVGRRRLPRRAPRRRPRRLVGRDGGRRGVVSGTPGAVQWSKR